ncbi:MAG: alanyl-tRNA editing protein [Clostridia bacterium]|nr:alanyl-tRNA editing protein [Clostridia bacterium]
MLTEKLFEKDSYLKEFTATVLACTEAGGEYAIVLDRTAFFCEGGGQYGDGGVLTADGITARVRETVPRQGEIAHLADAPLPVGAQVTGKIDFETRYRNMQNHSGEHVVCGLIHARYGFDNVGFHLGRDYVSLDINGVLTPEELAKIEEDANGVIYANVPITVSFPDEDALAAMEYRSKKELTGEVRIVTIEGYDRCACCAPHVARTGEIGLIKLLNPMHYKGGIRVFMQCGSSALRDYNERQSRIEAISHLLSAKQEDVVAAVERMKNELSEARQTASALRRALVEERLAALTETAGNTLFFETALDVGSLRLLVNGAVEKTGGAVCAFLGSDEAGYSYLMASRRYPMRTAAKAFREALGAKGGGSDEMIQGSVQATRASLCAWANDYFKEETV